MVRDLRYLYTIVLYFALFWKASLVFADSECTRPAGIEKCWGCPRTHPADLTLGPRGHGFRPFARPCSSDTVPNQDQGPVSKGGPGSNRLPVISVAPAATTSNVPSRPPGGPARRVFHLTVTWATRSPDGHARDLFLINDQFPGPTLELNEGDDVEVYLQNKTPFNTTIHFHGIEQFHTPWSDGVPGITQRGVRPGETFIYRWRATQYGSHWYHSHQSSQIDDGLFGPIVIHPSRDRATPFSLISSDPDTLDAIQKAAASVRPLSLSDWSKFTSPQRAQFTVKSGIVDLCYDSLLFNGKGNVRCYTPAELQNVITPSQSAGLSLVNAKELTAKGCLPATAVSFLAPLAAKNFSALPSDVYDVCNPTTGSREVIDVVRSGDGEKWLALDLIAAYGVLSVVFSIDSHPMYIYAVDGAFVDPILVDAIPLENGARFSVLIKLQDLGNFKMRVSSISPSQSISNYAILSYHEAGQPAPKTPSAAYIDDIGVNTTSTVRFFSQSQMRSFPPVTIPQKADNTFVLHMIVAGETYLWALNSTIYPLTYQTEKPLLFFPRPFLSDNVTISTLNNTWVDLVFVVASWPQPPHPIHKHGGKMFLIGQGTGPFLWETVAEAMEAVPESFNFDHPPRRDTLATPTTSDQPAWMAVRYYSNDPGAWFLHCHISPHLDGGMSVAIQDGVDAFPVVPPEYLEY